MRLIVRWGIVDAERSNSGSNGQLPDCPMRRGFPPASLAVGLLERIAAVADCERPVRAPYDIDRVARVVFGGKVRNKGFGDVVILAAFIREVKLPEVFEAGRLL